MRTYLARTPLRVKLVAAVMALVTLALVIIVTSSTLVFRQYLVNRIDDDLQNTAAGITDELRTQLSQPFGASSDQTLIVPTAPFVVEQLPPTGHIRVDMTPGLQQSDLPPMLTTAAQMRARQGGPYTASSQDGASQWRVLVTTPGGGYYVLLAQSISSVDKAVGRLLLIEVVAGLAVLVVLGAGAVAVVRTSLRPLKAIEGTAAAIAAGDLTQRIPDFEQGSDAPRTEVGRLGRALNVMLRQIEVLFNARALSERRARNSEERMRQFVADASHELRTPLTTIRGFAELYRQGAVRTPEQTADLLRRIEGEARRMGLLVEDMLLLARLDRERPLALAPLDLRVIATDAVEAARAVAPDRGITLQMPAGAGSLVIEGDEARLRQVVGNLMTNAIVHTPPGTPVWLRLRRDGDEAVIEVADRGPGLTEEQAARVFERFYRADAARTRRGPGGEQATSGSGLGLAIVSALVAAHGGRVAVDTAPGQGATFRVNLPLSAPQRPQDADEPDEPSAWAPPPAGTGGGGTGAGGATRGTGPVADGAGGWRPGTAGAVSGVTVSAAGAAGDRGAGGQETTVPTWP